MASRLMIVLVLLVLLALPFPMEANLGRFFSFLGHSHQFAALRKRITGQAKQLIKHRLRHPHNELTFFFPTDDALRDLPHGFLESLTADNRTQLWLLHALPKYFNQHELRTATNPLRTLANEFTLNITIANNTVNVTTGRVTARVSNAIYDKYPTVYYPIDAVLIPPALASQKPPPVVTGGHM